MFRLDRTQASRAIPVPQWDRVSNHLLPPPVADHFGTNIESARLIDAEIEDFREKIRALKTRRNSLILIARLPPEILSTVFQFLQIKLPRAYHRTNDNEWILVSHVCTHWRRVALDCPNLWARINLNTAANIALGEVALERSKQAHLTLSAEILPSSEGVIQTALTNMRRIRSLTISIPTQLPATVDPLMEVLETHPAPILERLSITGPRNGDATRPLAKLFGGTYPVLRELKLVGCSVAWDNLRSLGTLVDLHLDCSSQPTLVQCPSAVQLASILRNAPNLKYLTFHGTITPSPVGYTIGSPVILPHLFGLWIESNIDQCIEIFDYISYPADSFISVKPFSTSNYTTANALEIIRRTLNPKRLIGVQTIFQYLRVECPSILKDDYNDDTLVIEVWDDPSHVENIPPRIEFVIHISENDLSSFTGTNQICLWNILPLEGLQMLHIVQSDLSESLWVQIGVRLKHLTTLKLGHTVNTDSLGILKVLSSTLPTAHQSNSVGSSLMYFPTLRQLSILDWDFGTLPHGNKQTSKLLKQLLSVLKTRKKRGFGVEVVDIRICRYLSESGVEDIRKFSSVVWDGLVEVSSEDDSEDSEDGDDD